MRTFVVGDVHGHSAKLDSLLAQLCERSNQGDRLVFIGDYVDRGPDSRGVIDRVRKQQQGAWSGPVVALMGNHEELMLDCIENTGRYTPENWLECGGLETIVSYVGESRSLEILRCFAAGSWDSRWANALPAEHLQFLRTLAAWHEDEHGIYVHAGIPPGKRPEEVTPEVLRWIRAEFLQSDYQWDKVVVFGHTPQYEADSRQGPGRSLNLDHVRWQPLNRPEKIGIDTGAGYGGPLSAVILPDREILFEPPAEPNNTGN